MSNRFNLYEQVKIKFSDETGTVVAVDTDGGTKPPIYFVEKDDKFKNGENDLVWLEASEISNI